MINAALKQPLLNMAYLFLARGIDLFIPLFLTPYLIRVIGLDKLGVIAFSLAVAGYFGMIIRFGFNITAVRDISRVVNNHRQVVEAFNSNLFASITLAIFCIVFFTFSIFIFRDEIDETLFFAAFIYAVFQALLPVWLFQAIEKVKTIAILSGVFKLFYVFSVLIFVKEPSDFRLVVLLNAFFMMFLFLTSIGIINCNYNINIYLPKFEAIKVSLLRSKNAFLTQLAPSLYNNSSTFVLGMYSTDKVVGIYSAVMGLLEALISIGRVILGAFFATLAKDISSYKLFSLVMTSLGILISFILMVFSNNIIYLYFSHQNELASTLLFISAASIFGGFMFLSNNSGFLMVTGYESLAKNITVISSLIAFIMSLILIFYFQAIGAAIAVVVARLLLGIVSWFFVHRIKNDK